MAPAKRQTSSEATGMGPRKKTRIHVSPRPTRNITTRFMTRSSTSNAVFLTTELLENILICLPMKDLLLAQRVCRKWRDVIKKSSQMQEAIFLKAARPTVAWKFSSKSWEMYKIKMERLAEVPKVEPSVESKVTFTAALNNMLLHYPDRAETSTAASAVGEIFEFKDDARWRHQVGSWQRMFVTQPPATAVYAEYIYGDWKLSRPGRGRKTFEFVQPGGVTLGELVDHALKLEANGDGEKMRWDRCRFQASCRVFPSEEEAKMTTIEE